MREFLLSTYFTCFTCAFFKAQHISHYNEYRKNPLIVYVDKTKFVNQGDDLHLTCQVENFVDQTITWSLLRKGQPPVILTLGESRVTKDQRFISQLSDLTLNKKMYNLNINHIRNDDSGNFTCQISSNNHPIERSIEVYVRTPPVIGEDITRDMVIYEGSNIELKCNATGFPKPRICWKRADLRPLPNGEAIYCSNVLRIQGISKKDRGKFMCIADNDNVQNSLGFLPVLNDIANRPNNFFVGSDEMMPQNRRTVDVKVEFSPTFPITINGPKIAVGQAPFRRLDALLECFVEGYPPPRVWWTKVEPSTHNAPDLNQLVKTYHVENYTGADKYNSLTETFINDGKDYNVSLYRDVQDELTVSKLRIVEVQNSDFGFYKCYAENTRGKSSLLFTFTESFTAYQIGGNVGFESFEITSSKIVLLPSSIIFYILTILITLFFY